MPASSAWSTGARNAALSTTASAMPSALAVMAVLVASTISATTELTEPVHWYSTPSSLQASSAPYWVGVKNGLVVTWQTKTNFHDGVFGEVADRAGRGFRFVGAAGDQGRRGERGAEQAGAPQQAAPGQSDSA